MHNAGRNTVQTENPPRWRKVSCQEVPGPLVRDM